MLGAATLLLAIRAYALLLMQSAWWSAAGRAWAWVALVVASGWALGSAASGNPRVDSFDASWMVPAIVSEALLGAVLGGVATLPGHALLGAARQQATTLGVRAAPWRTLSAASAAALALHLGLHRPAIAGLGALDRRFPVGQPELWSLPANSVEGLIGAASSLLVVGLALATPVLLVAAVVALVLGALGTPRGDGAAVGAAAAGLRVCGALAALAAAWATYPEIWAQGVIPGSLELPGRSHAPP